MQGNRDRFVTTQWTLVRAAGLQSPEGAAALAELCAAYWYPVFAFVRRRGHASEEAQDLTQSFFARVIEKGDVGGADQTRGRFRTFLLTACENFLHNERDRARTLKRGGGQVLIPIDAARDEERYRRSFADEETPEHLYHRQWALALLGAALDELREEYLRSGRENVFDRLRSFVTLDEQAGSHAEAAGDLGISPEAVKVAVHRLRRRYRAVLRARVAGTVDSPEAVEDEMRDLVRVLRQV